MKFKLFPVAVLMMGSLLSLSSCVDNKYDLDDIDTTTAIKLDGLVVPVRLNTITLDEVLDIDENDPDNDIKVGYDDMGNKFYYIEKSGDFSADPVFINDLKLISYVSVPSISLPASVTEITDETRTFSYTINNVDPALISLTYFRLKEGEQMEVSLDINPSSVTMSDVVLQIPSSYIADYNGQVITGGEIPVNVVNGQLEYPLYITEMNFVPELKPNREDDSLQIYGEIGFKSAKISNNTSETTIIIKMSPFTANVVSGEISKMVDDPQINNVNLNDMPDYLRGDGTNVILENPQLYLDFSYIYGAYYNADMVITPMGNGGAEVNIPMNKFQESLLIAPDPDKTGIDIALNTVKQPNTGLQRILSGDGLPTQIAFKLMNTGLSGEAEKVQLGQDIQISGSYTFYTPFALAEGSTIIYSKKEQNFFGDNDDFQYVEMSEFHITADVTSNLPFATKLTIYPLDKNGNRIYGEKGNEISASSSVSAYAQNDKLDLAIMETFYGLDGVEYIVTASDTDGREITPDEYVELNNIRGKITGQYVTKF